MSKIDFNALRDRAYKTACEHGFHDNELSNEHFLCLVICELMEAVEADRVGIIADLDAFKRYEGKITFEENFKRHIKDSVTDELADAVIRLLDLAGSLDTALKIYTILWKNRNIKIGITL